MLAEDLLVTWLVLGVFPRQVGDAGDEGDADGGVHPVAVVAVEPVEVPRLLRRLRSAAEAAGRLHIRTRDTAELELAIERIRANPKAERTKTVIVLSRLLGPGTPSPAASPAASRRRR